MNLFKNETQKKLTHKIYLLAAAALILFGTIWGLCKKGYFDFEDLRYFTYLSNLFVVIGFVILFILYDKKPIARSYFLGSIMLAISVTGLVYNFVLVPFADNDMFFSSYTNFSNHLFSMILTLVNYFLFEKKGLFKYKNILIGMIFPFVYWLVFALSGGATGFYPYFFMNVANLGWGMALVWLLILLAAFAFLGFLLLVFDRAIGKKENLLWIYVCRIYQFIFKIGVRILPWRRPVLLEGEKSVEKLPAVLKEKEISGVLIVTDQTLYDLGMLDRLEKCLKENEIKYSIYKDTCQNPTIENVEEAVENYKENGCEAIIAFGGGSPIDCAKAAGARIVKPEKPVAKMAGIFKVLKKLPLLIAVPTTAGTGSETTLAAVITDTKTHRKFAINDLSLIPRYAVLDPSLTVNLPKALTAATGMDALTHAVEAYIGRSNSKETNKAAEKAFVLIKENLLKAYANGADMEARKNMLTASHYAGLAFTKAYVGNIHAAAHTLSGFYGIPHGLANAVLLPIILEYYGKAVYKKLARIAAIMNIGNELKTTEEKAKALILYIKDLNTQMGIPDTIEGLKDEDLPQMIKNALREANPLYPVPAIFNKYDFKNIFDLVRSK